MKSNTAGLWERLTRKIYIEGKRSYEKAAIRALYGKGNVHESVHFSLNADLQNLGNDRNAISIGERSNIEGLILVYSYGGKVSIGKFCSLSPNARLISVDGIRIGNRVLIAHNVNIIDNNSHPLDAEERHIDFMNSMRSGMKKVDLRSAPIIIEDDVWIGHNCSIHKGVTIGRGAIIGSNSVVTKDVAAWTINAGNPLRLLREADKKDEKK